MKYFFVFHPSGHLARRPLRMFKFIPDEFMANFLCCCKKVCSGDRRPPWMVEGRITQEQLSITRSKKAMDCGRVAMLLKVREVHILSGRRPCTSKRSAYFVTQRKSLTAMAGS